MLRVPMTAQITRSAFDGLGLHGNEQEAIDAACRGRLLTGTLDQIRGFVYEVETARLRPVSEASWVRRNSGTVPIPIGAVPFPPMLRPRSAHVSQREWQAPGQRRDRSCEADHWRGTRRRGPLLAERLSESLQERANR